MALRVAAENWRIDSGHTWFYLHQIRSELLQNFHCPPFDLHFRIREHFLDLVSQARKLIFAKFSQFFQGKAANPWVGIRETPYICLLIGLDIGYQSKEYQGIKPEVVIAF